MLKLQLLFAAAGAVDPAADLPHEAGTTNSFGGDLKELLLIAGIAAVLALTLFLYVYITRRDRRIHTVSGSRAIYRAEKRNRHGQSSRDTARDGEGNTEQRRLRKKRRRAEEFSNRNPTLGETGGLPPLRDEPVEPAQ